MSTVLNIIYFLRTVVTIYRRSDFHGAELDRNIRPAFCASVACFIALNLYLGMGAGGVMKLIANGINLW